MFLKKYKIIGILGGMGPEATVDLYNRIINITLASKDQDHIPVLIFSNPKIPDRTASINSDESKKIIQYLVESAVILEKGGADFIIIPCNTAHKYISEIQKSVKIPVINMIKETVLHLIKEYPDIKEVGLIGTSGTLKTKLYQNYLEKENIKATVPGSEVQEQYVMKAIYGIKSDGKIAKAEKLLQNAIKTLPETAQKVVIMGCTEIPLALRKPFDSVKLINPTNILAQVAVEKILHKK